jgi:hypothetical protein
MSVAGLIFESATFTPSADLNVAFLNLDSGSVRYPASTTLPSSADDASSGCLGSTRTV